MTQINQIYKCNVCGNIVEMTHDGIGQLVCCGQPMELKAEQTSEEGLTEKHRPVVEEGGDGVTIKVGSIPHPMEEKHFIEWIEIFADGKLCRYSLKPGDEPKIDSCLKECNSVRAYCNVHGLWKN